MDVIIEKWGVIVRAHPSEFNVNLVLANSRPIADINCQFLDNQHVRQLTDKQKTIAGPYCGINRQVLRWAKSPIANR